jgi:hypothetical protein
MDVSIEARVSRALITSAMDGALTAGTSII